ncbi:MAG: threonine ammonia-lyase [Promethearchaeota archaeon]
MVVEAAAALAPHVKRTPCVKSDFFSDLFGCEAWLKLENLQHTGSFKLRGALFKMMSLSRELNALEGVVTASAGNHGQGVAWAARLLGVSATVVVPVHSPLVKIASMRGMGATVVEYGSTYDEAYRRALELRDEHGWQFVHAFDDPLVAAGQGTIGLELAKQVPDVDVVVVPVGGGGLVSGIAVALEDLSVEVHGVQAASFPAVHAALHGAGQIVNKRRIQPATIAEGVAVKKPGATTLPVIRRRVRRVHLASEEAIAMAILQLMEKEKLVVEGAGALPLALQESEEFKRCVAGRNVAFVLSGGNIDINLLDRIIQLGLAKAGRYYRFTCLVRDVPGELFRLLGVVKDADANVLEVQHERRSLGVPLGYAEVTLHVETRDADHANLIKEALVSSGHRPETLPPGPFPTERGHHDQIR